MFGKLIGKVLTASFMIMLCSGIFTGMAAAESDDGGITHTMEMRHGNPCLVFHGETLTTPACWVAIRTNGPDKVVTTGELETTDECLVVYNDIQVGGIYTFGIGTEESRFEYYGPYEVTITENDIKMAQLGL